jgi:hypothetical protein
MGPSKPPAVPAVAVLVPAAPVLAPLPPVLLLEMPRVSFAGISAAHAPNKHVSAGNQLYREEHRCAYMIILRYFLRDIVVAHFVYVDA